MYGNPEEILSCSHKQLPYERLFKTLKHDLNWNSAVCMVRDY